MLSFRLHSYGSWTLVRLNKHRDSGVRCGQLVTSRHPTLWLDSFD